MKKRIIIYDGKQIPDDYPTLPAKAVQKMLADQYPEIINSSMMEKIDESTGNVTIEFSSAVKGTRG